MSKQGLHGKETCGVKKVRFFSQARRSNHLPLKTQSHLQRMLLHTSNNVMVSDRTKMLWEKVLIMAMKKMKFALKNSDQKNVRGFFIHRVRATLSYVCRFNNLHTVRADFLVMQNIYHCVSTLWDQMKKKSNQF